MRAPRCKIIPLADLSSGLKNISRRSGGSSGTWSHRQSDGTPSTSLGKAETKRNVSDYTATLYPAANLPINITGLEARFLTPVSVFSPRTKYYETHVFSNPIIHSEPEKDRLPDLPVHQLSVSSTWRSLKVTHAELLHLIQDSFRIGLESLLRDKLWDNYLQDQREGLFTECGTSYSVSFHCEELVDFVWNELEHFSRYRNVSRIDLQELVFLYFRSCDCLEENDDEEDVAIDFSLRIHPGRETLDAEIVTKLDFITVTSVDLHLHEGAKIDIIPKYNQGASFNAVKQIIKYELHPPIDWLSWTGFGWVGVVPDGLAKTGYIKLGIRGTSTEYAGHIALEKVVRASLTLQVLPSVPVPAKFPPMKAASLRGKTTPMCRPFKSLRRNTINWRDKPKRKVFDIWKWPTIDFMSERNPHADKTDRGSPSNASNAGISPTSIDRTTTSSIGTWITESNLTSLSPIYPTIHHSRVLEEWNLDWSGRDEAEQRHENSDATMGLDRNNYVGLTSDLD
ncbi:MAG: hypothetical protein MMC23_008649 [Stictis urceolatum]|nr:hypothetical protein [Stictis urceolata]